MTFDDFGRRFICYNRVQVQHVVISSKTLRRNPHLAFSETVQNCPAETVAEPLEGPRRRGPAVPDQPERDDRRLARRHVHRRLRA